MKKIEAMVSPECLESVTERLTELEIRSVVISQATCLGEPLQRRRVYRGSSYTVDAAQLIKLELIARDELLEPVLAILRHAVDSRSGTACVDAEVVVMSVEQVITRATRSDRPVARQGTAQKLREAARPGLFESVASVTAVPMRLADRPSGENASAN